MKLYLDTCVWIDFLDEEREGHRKAVKLFGLVQKENSEVLISKIHDYEMAKAGYRRLFKKIKEEMKQGGFCKETGINEEDKDSAIKLDSSLKCGVADCLHVLTAARGGAILVSSDFHWQEIADALGKQCFNYGLFFKYF
ncbi:MAG: PIN domain-containing protein [Candidatus Micrarchaeota archaeon]